MGRMGSPNHHFPSQINPFDLNNFIKSEERQEGESDDGKKIEERAAGEDGGEDDEDGEHGGENGQDGEHGGENGEDGEHGGEDDEEGEGGEWKCPEPNCSKKKLYTEKGLINHYYYHHKAKAGIIAKVKKYNKTIENTKKGLDKAKELQDFIGDINDNGMPLIQEYNKNRKYFENIFK